MICAICNSTEVTQELVNEVFTINGALVIVEQIPANVCASCGDITYSRETTEKIRRLIHGEQAPTRSAEFAVYEYA